jgi:hypothetical protein
MSIPAIALNNSPTTWLEVPLPVRALNIKAN